MAVSSASKAASKLLNFGNHGLQNLISRHLLRPSAAAPSTSTHLIASISATDSRYSNTFQLEHSSRDSLAHLANPSNFNLPAYNFPPTLQFPVNTYGQTIEVARTYVRTTNDYDDDFVDEDSQDSDDDSDDGGESDFDDVDEFDDPDEDMDPPTRSRKDDF